jgi:hypothetical protein
MSPLSAKHKLKFMPFEEFEEALSKLDREGNDALFFALASDLEDEGIKIYVLPRKRQKLVNPTAGINRGKQERMQP